MKKPGGGLAKPGGLKKLGGSKLDDKVKGVAAAAPSVDGGFGFTFEAAERPEQKGSAHLEEKNVLNDAGGFEFGFGSEAAPPAEIFSTSSRNLEGGE